ncbi:MAG: hypothetical protein IPG87_16810 [Saprospiraceae bacterium]|nr:hypothetical protein [Candidatus Vicinibacter affinis]
MIYRNLHQVLFSRFVRDHSISIQEDLKFKTYINGTIVTTFTNCIFLWRTGTSLFPEKLPDLLYWTW